MTATALEPGAAKPGHMARARKRTAPATTSEASPDAPWRTLSPVLPALLSEHPEWEHLLAGHAPSYGCPVAEGQSWQAAEPGIREDAERAAGWQQENMADSLGDAGRRAGWELENRLHTQALHAQAAILHDAGLLGVLTGPTDSAPAVGDEPAAGAGTSSGPAEEPPPTSAGPDPAGGSEEAGR